MRRRPRDRPSEAGKGGLLPMTEFDLIIIGGGAGAFAAAIKANELALAFTKDATKLSYCVS